MHFSSLLYSTPTFLLFVLWSLSHSPTVHIYSTVPIHPKAPHVSTHLSSICLLFSIILPLITRSRHTLLFSFCFFVLFNVLPSYRQTTEDPVVVPFVTTPVFSVSLSIYMCCLALSTLTSDSSSSARPVSHRRYHPGLTFYAVTASVLISLPCCFYCWVHFSEQWLPS